MSGYIIGILQVCEQASLARSVCRSAVKNISLLILRVYVRLLIGTSVSLYLALNVRSSVRICYDSLYVHMRPLDDVCFSLWFIVCAYASLDDVCFSLSLCAHTVVVFSLNTSISVRLYCHWLYANRYVFWSTFFHLILSLFVSVSGILSVILRVYVLLLLFISFSLFVSKCV